MVMSTVYGYARTSTVEQSYGLEGQIEKLQAAGIAVKDIFSEQVSAADLEGRKQWNKLVSLAQAGDSIMITTLSRMARTVPDMVEIMKKLDSKGVGLVVQDMKIDSNTASGKMMLNIFMSFSQFERDIMKERQLIGIEKAKAEGKYKGRKPTALAKADSVKALLATGMTKEQIAKDLNIGIASVYRICKATGK
jgi:DNA invertase Pin-like site-specific DNA recombinase